MISRKDANSSSAKGNVRMQRSVPAFLKHLITRHVAVIPLAFLKNLYEGIRQTQSLYHQVPGLRGGLPYLAIVRLIASLGIALRFTIYSTLAPLGSIFPCIIATYALFSLAILAASLRKEHTRNIKMAQLSLCVDITVITISFVTTYDPKSDIYLFYFLAILTSFEYFTPRHLVFTTLATIALLLSAYALFAYEIHLIKPTEAFFRIAAPRTLLFVLVFIILYTTRQEALRRAAAMGALDSFRKTRPDSFDLEHLVRRTMDAVTSVVKPAHIHLSLFHPSRNGLACIHLQSQSIFDLNEVNKIDNAIYRSHPEALNSSHFTGTWISLLTDVQLDRELSYLYIPLRKHSTFYGYLCVSRPKGELYTDQDEVYLTSFLLEFLDELVRYRLVSSLSQIRQSLARASDAHANMAALLQTVVHKIGFEFAAISVVDHYLGKIRMQRGENIPEGWLEKADHDLRGEDIQADIVRNQKAEIIEGPDPRFDQNIYKRYHHERLKRIFAPIYDEDGQVIRVGA